MQIITPTNISGSTSDMKMISAITRFVEVDTIVIRSEQTNIEYTFQESSTPDATLTFESFEESYYQNYELTYLIDELTFKEGENYQITMYSESNEVLFKGKLFVTDQLPNIANNNGKYSINKGQYKPYNGSDSDNDFIVID